MLYMYTERAYYRLSTEHTDLEETGRILVLM